MCLLTLWLLLLSQDLVDILNGGVSLDTLGGLAGLDPNALIGNVTEDTIAGTSVKAAEDFFCFVLPSHTPHLLFSFQDFLIGIGVNTANTTLVDPALLAGLIDPDAVDGALNTTVNVGTFELLVSRDCHVTWR